MRAGERMTNPFDEYATTIWNNAPDVARDHHRWHASGHHIEPRSISIDEAVEDAHEALDIDPEELGIHVNITEWQHSYLDDPRMIAAMARVAYQGLRQYGRYAFSSEPDWEAAAIVYLKQYE